MAFYETFGSLEINRKGLVMARLVFALVLILLGGLPALAGPEGTYAVTGTNPGGRGQYTGTVSVSRKGETYSVVWNIAGTQFFGTGLGSQITNGVRTIGPANPNDSTISIGYISQGSFGLAMYVEQPGGQWSGIWTYGGGAEVGTEIWTPR